MPTSAYRKWFSEHQPGGIEFVEILRRPVEPLRDPPLSEQSHAQLQDIIRITAKKSSISALVHIPLVQHKSLLLAELSLKLAKPVYAINHQLLENLHPGNLSRAFADAEAAQAILFFDEADAILDLGVEDDDSQFIATHLLKLASTFAGLCLFDIQHKTQLEILSRRFDYVIQ